MTPGLRRALGIVTVAVIGLSVALTFRTASVEQAVAQPTPAPASPEGIPTPAATPHVPEDEAGPFVYLRDCAWCHGAEGQGAVYGPPLIGVGRASTDFMLSTGRMPIDRPVDFPGTQLPRQPPVYDPETIRELVDHVATFGAGGPDIPEIDSEAASLGEGQVLYQEHCAACHGSTGGGGALTAGWTAPPVYDATALEIAESIRIGGAGFRTGNMPRFGPDTLSDEELNAVVRYTLYLQNPQDAGGAPLERLGPVAEGFVALAIALVFLILFLRWIGERTAVAEEGEESHGS